MTAQLTEIKAPLFPQAKLVMLEKSGLAECCLLCSDYSIKCWPEVGQIQTKSNAGTRSKETGLNFFCFFLLFE